VFNVGKKKASENSDVECECIGGQSEFRGPETHGPLSVGISSSSDDSGFLRTPCGGVSTQRWSGDGSPSCRRDGSALAVSLWPEASPSAPGRARRSRLRRDPTRSDHRAPRQFCDRQTSSRPLLVSGTRQDGAGVVVALRTQPHSLCFWPHVEATVMDLYSFYRDPHIWIRYIRDV